MFYLGRVSTMNYTTINRYSWDKRTEIHFTSEMYDVDGFLKGSCKLKEIELNELPDVGGKKLLHLQCHFGMDTLSWARRGAKVTGVDFSPVAIERANELKERSSLEAEFICSEISDFADRSRPEYDIVFVSYGALCWLPDMDEWAKVVSKNLKIGGELCLVEFHPMYDFVTGYSYFHSVEPDVEEEGTYTENCPGELMPLVTWAHPISEVINSVVGAGMRIESFKEYPFSPCDCFENLEEGEPGRFYLSGTKHQVPLVYSLKGIKVAEDED